LLKKLQTVALWEPPLPHKKWQRGGRNGKHGESPKKKTGRDEEEKKGGGNKNATRLNSSITIFQRKITRELAYIAQKRSHKIERPRAGGNKRGGRMNPDGKSKSKFGPHQAITLGGESVVGGKK